MHASNPALQSASHCRSAFFVLAADLSAVVLAAIGGRGTLALAEATGGSVVDDDCGGALAATGAFVVDPDGATCSASLTSRRLGAQPSPTMITTRTPRTHKTRPSPRSNALDELSSTQHTYNA
jgi:hypothetical protein